MKDRIGISQNLDQRLSLDLPFKDETGKDVKLGDYFKDKPVLIIPVFYECQGVCRLILNGVITAFKGMRTYDVGKDFEVVTFSIHPEEGPELASKMKAEVLDLYQRQDAAKGWHFLTGKMPAITKLTGEIGFKFWYNPETKQINHPAAIMVCTPDGIVSRYFVDKDYPSKMLRDSLINAGQERIGTRAEERLLGCLVIDPVTGKRSLNFLRITMLLCILTVAVVGTWVTVLSIKNRRSVLPPKNIQKETEE